MSPACSVGSLALPPRSSTADWIQAQQLWVPLRSSPKARTVCLL
jgi:hypothetical protein